MGRYCRTNELSSYKEVDYLHLGELPHRYLLVPELHHIVYVIELNIAVLKEPKFVKANPNRNPDLPCVYVGLTGLTAEQRFENHRRGHKSRGFAHKYCVKLLPKLYEHIPAMTWEDSETMERNLAEELKSKGYAVWWN